MVKTFSVATTLAQLERALENIATLYTSSCVNWKGNATENLSYSEKISGQLLKYDIKERLSRIPAIQRKNYNIEHDGIIRNHGSNRHEEKFAIALHNKDRPFIGKIINYQVPLKARQTDKAGKIDLIAFREDPNNAVIVELKFKDNAETLLRAVLEIVTYYHQLSHKNFIDSYNVFAGLQPQEIKKAFLLGEGTQSYNDAMHLERFPNLSELMKELQIEVFGIRVIDRCLKWISF